MHDTFSSMTEADVQAMHVPLPALLPTEAHFENPANRFRFDDYEWEGFKVPGQVTVKLTQGYFTFIGEEDEDLLDDKSVFAHVHRCPRTNILLNVRAALKVDGVWTFLHRFLMSARKGVIIDHVNNLPLDNRRFKNLWGTSSGANNANRFRERITNKALKRGVEPRGECYGGKIKFQGVTYRSAQVWDDQDVAHQWHLAKYKELYGFDVLATKPERSFPIFPPKREEEIPF